MVDAHVLNDIRQPLLLPRFKTNKTVASLWATHAELDSVLYTQHTSKAPHICQEILTKPNGVQPGKRHAWKIVMNLMELIRFYIL